MNNCEHSEQIWLVEPIANQSEERGGCLGAEVEHFTIYHPTELIIDIYHLCVCVCVLEIC